MTTPANDIPWVPENTQDPAAGLNDALRVIDALLQCAVIDTAQTSPPGSPSDGDQYIVASGGTGDWSGKDGHLARYVADGSFWQFYAPGQIRFVFDESTGELLVWHSSAWAVLASV